MSPVMSPVAATGGLVLGADASGPVTLGLFRPRPTRVLAVGPASLVQVLAWRALAVGTGVTVRTSEPAPWLPLREAAPGCCSFQVVEPLVPLDAAGLPYRPALLVDHARVGQVTPMPWQALVDWRPEGNLPEVEELRIADVALVVGPDERVLGRLARAHGLTAAQVDGVRAAGGGGLVASWPRSISVVSIALTAQEQELTGLAEPPGPSTRVNAG